jgi:ribosome-binding factor A
MPSRRPQRINSAIHEAIAEILLREVKDPRVHNVTVTAVNVGPDLKLAKVYFSTLRPEDREPALEGLRSASGYIKRQVATHLRLRHTPEIRFLFDETLEKANRLESLLRQVEQKES